MREKAKKRAVTALFLDIYIFFGGASEIRTRVLRGQLRRLLSQSFLGYFETQREKRQTRVPRELFLYERAGINSIKS